MANGVGSPDGTRSGLRIRAPQDFYGGLVLIALATFALWAGRDLPGMHGFAFGPGTAPRLFATLLIILGGVISVVGLLTDGPAIPRFAIRGPMWVTASILSFSASIRPAGLIIASFMTFMIAAMASKETRWVESTIMAVAMTAFCVFLFPYALNLPFQLWPRF